MSSKKRAPELQTIQAHVHEVTGGPIDQADVTREVRQFTKGRWMEIPVVYGANLPMG